MRHVRLMGYMLVLLLLSGYSLAEQQEFHSIPSRDSVTQPLWLIGNSRGTISAANCAVRNKHKTGPDGIVLTSSVTRKIRKNLDSLDDIELSDITVPTYVVHHKEDGCKVTPYNVARDLLDRLTAVRVKEFRGFSGGENPGKPCKGNSYHGFLGIEDTVVQDIVSWIKTH